MNIRHLSESESGSYEYSTFIGIGFVTMTKSDFVIVTSGWTTVEYNEVLSEIMNISRSYEYITRNISDKTSLYKYS